MTIEQQLQRIFDAIDSKYSPDLYPQITHVHDGDQRYVIIHGFDYRTKQYLFDWKHPALNNNRVDTDRDKQVYADIATSIQTLNVKKKNKA